MNVHPKLALTMIAMLGADLEREMGDTLDWVCARAAEEQIPVGHYIAEVVKQYRNDLVAQEARERQRAVQRRRDARLTATIVASQSAASVVGVGHAVPHRDRPDNDQG